MSNYFSERKSTILAFAIVVWSLIWLLLNLQSGGWIRGDFLIEICIGLFIIASFPAIIILIVFEITKFVRNRQSPLVEIILLLILVGSFWFFRLIPTYPGYVYRQHKDEFHSVVEKGLERFHNSNSQEIKLSGIQPYSGDMYSDNHHNGDTIVAEFVISDFYLPLVYIQSDNPEDVYDTCSAGGSPTEKLDENWYVCSRDWN